MAINCGHCKSTHPTVADVKACAGLVPATPAPTTVSEAWHGKCASTHAERQAAVVEPVAMPRNYENRATERQMNFLCSLLAECANLSDPEHEHTAESFQASFAEHPISKHAASQAIQAAKDARDELKRTAPAHTAAAELEDGMYQRPDGTVVKVYHTVHGANQQAAKVLVITEPEPGKYEGEFEYVGKRGLVGLTAAMRLSQEEAAKLGQVYGFCIRCGKTLTLEESQHVGYGKTCAGHEGWWYPTRAELKALTATSA